VVLREAANRLLSQRVELENADYQILTGNRNRCRNLEGDPHEARTLCGNFVSVSIICLS